MRKENTKAQEQNMLSFTKTRRIIIGLSLKLTMVVVSMISQ